MRAQVSRFGALIVLAPTEKAVLWLTREETLIFDSAIAD
jgi:hypothetical protein